MAVPTFVKGAAGNNAANTESTSVTATLASGAAAGNLLVAVVAGDKDSISITLSGNATTSGTWTHEVFLRSASVSLWIGWKVAVGGETTLTATRGGGGSSGNSMYLSEWNQAGSGAWGVTGKVTRITTETSVSSWTTNAPPNVDRDAIALALFTVDSNLQASSPTYTAGWTARYDAPTTIDGNAGVHLASRGVTQGGNAGNCTFTMGGSDQISGAQVAFGRVASTPPTANAGADATVNQHSTFSRTATDADNGAAITARSWTVQAGPDYVGSTLSTAAALSWVPRTPGTYTLRYSATNSAGTTTDDMVLTVTAVTALVYAPIKLAATRTGAKLASSARTAALVLAGSMSGGIKRHSITRSAPMVLAASMVGQRINLVVAPLRLSAALLSSGSSNQANVTAPLKLVAHVAGLVHGTVGGPVTAPLHLAASRVGTSHRSRTVSANLRLFAARAGAKAVAVTRDAPIRIFAAVPAWLHNGVAAREAHLALGATISGRHRTNEGWEMGADLPLHAAVATSSRRFVITVEAPMVLRAQAFTERIVLEAQALRPQADTLVKYELVAVARIPQVSGPPLFLEIDPIDWTSLTWGETLNSPPELQVDLKIETITEPILQRLRTPHELPTELWLNRNGRRVFSGPLLGGAVNGENLSLTAQGTLVYTKMWNLEADYVQTDVDQADAVKYLITQWQNLEYGHFGLDVTGINPTGVLRTIEWKSAEIHWVYDRIMDFVGLADGYDIWVDPATRIVNLASPRRGIDRSSGEDAIVFDSRNVTNSNVAFSMAPGDVASDGFGTATNSGADTPLISRFSNSELRSKFGRAATAGNFQVADQGSLDAAVQGLVNARDQVLLIPGPDARVTLDADIASYDVGDTIAYQAHARLSGNGAYRIRKRSVKVSGTGTESVSVEFV